MARGRRRTAKEADMQADRSRAQLLGSADPDGTPPAGRYQVYRTTADQLGAVLNEIEALSREAFLVQWLGGRDWIVISQPIETALAEPADEPLGWVDERERRHRRFDEAVGDDMVGYGYLPGGPTGAVLLVEPEVEFGNVRYGRYDEHRIGTEFTGWVEDVARTWIIFLGPHGAPRLYFPRRDSGGGVIGEPINLQA